MAIATGQKICDQAGRANKMGAVMRQMDHAKTRPWAGRRDCLVLLHLVP